MNFPGPDPAATIRGRLSDADWKALADVNAALVRMTEHHAHYCRCELCYARMLTDVQEEVLRVVRYTPAANPNN